MPVVCPSFQVMPIPHAPTSFASRPIAVAARSATASAGLDERFDGTRL